MFAMLRKFVVGGVVGLACLGGVNVSSVCNADGMQSQFGDPIVYKMQNWRYNSGQFVKSLLGNEWIEYNQYGQAIYRFVETKRGDDYVVMYDASRGFTVELTQRWCFVNGQGVHRGSWAN